MSNCVLLLSDEHNPKFTPVYGDARIAMPHLECIAANGVVYENAYCPSPLCLPSRSAFMSGHRVHAIQTYSNCNVNLQKLPTYAESLIEQGVYVVHIGKTDVFAPGDQLGFSEIHLAGDRALPGDTEHRRNPMTIRTGSSERAKGYGVNDAEIAKDEAVIDRAIRWLEETAPGLEQPWVLVVNVLTPHFPHFSPQSIWDQYADYEDLPAHGGEFETAQHPYLKALRDHFEAECFEEADVRRLRRGYYAGISFLDTLIGRLKAALEAQSFSDATNFVYASDHGEMLGKFGAWWKCSLLEDSVRIPIVASGPDFLAGVRSTAPVDLHDLRAAIFASTGASQPDGWVGQPLQGLELADPDRVVFSEYHGHGAPGSSYMVRQGDWKYIHYIDAEPQLFNLAEDPEELRNLATEDPAKCAELLCVLKRICDPRAEHCKAEAFIEAQLARIEQDDFSQSPQI